MKSLADLKIGTKVFLLAILILALSLVAPGYALIQITSIGKEFKEIAEEDVPIVNAVAQITVHQLEQAIELERAFRFGEVSVVERENQRDVPIEILQSLKRSTNSFKSQAKKVDEEFIEVEEMVSHAIKVARNEDSRREFEDVLRILKKLDKQHIEYEEHAIEVLELFETSNSLEEVEEKISEVEAEQSEFDAELEEVLVRLEEYTAQASLTAEKHQQEAEVNTQRGIMIASGVTFVIALVLSLLLTRAIAGPIVRLSQLMIKVATERDLTVQVPVRGTDEVGDMSRQFNNMVTNIREVFGQVNLSAANVAESSETMAQRATRNRETAMQQLERAKSSGEVVTEMGGGAKLVAEASMRQQEAALATEKVMQHMLELIDAVSGSAQSQSKEVQTTIDRIEEMGVTSARVVKTAQEQRDTAQSASTSMDAMTKAVQQMQEAVAEATQYGTESLQAAKEGYKSVEETVEGMSAIAESSEQISEIIDVITEIAEQTNLLALNAAIEAARAGAHGKGFAVVADEVGKLAQRSSEAAKEITQLIKDSTARVQEGSKLTLESQKSLAKIDESGRVNMNAIQAIETSATALQESNQSVRDMVLELNKLAESIAGMAGEQGARRQAAEEALANLQEESGKILNLVSEASDGVNDANQQMQGIVERTNEMTSVTDQQAVRSEKVTGLVNETADAAAGTTERAAEVVHITEELREQAKALNDEVNKFKIA